MSPGTGTEHRLERRDGVFLIVVAGCVGTEHHLTEEVECYWLPASVSAPSRDDARPVEKAQAAGARTSPHSVSRGSLKGRPMRGRGSRGGSPSRGSGSVGDSWRGYPRTRDASPAASHRFRDPSPSGGDRGRARMRDRSPAGLRPIRVPASQMR